MADSYRLTVLKRLTAHLKTISKANGYNFDLADEGGIEHVFRGRTQFGENDAVPLVSILEAPRADNGVFGGGKEVRSENWSLLIQGWAHDDVLHPTDPVYGLLDDVERHLFRLIKTNSGSGFATYPDEYLLGNTIAGITVSPGSVRPPMENVSSKAFFYLPISVVLVTGND